MDCHEGPGWAGLIGAFLLKAGHFPGIIHLIRGREKGNITTRAHTGKLKSEYHMKLGNTQQKLTIIYYGFK